MYVQLSVIFFILGILCVLIVFVCGFCCCLNSKLVFIVFRVFSRWVRLLFGREFPMQDLLMLWDAIFADSVSFDLVDYVFVAMLLYIRDASEFLIFCFISVNNNCLL
jgi:hypothetical protein